MWSLLDRQVPEMEDGTLDLDAELLLSKTPLPKAATEFSSIHLVQTAGHAKLFGTYF